jgi:coproporphyrinogen III oxidase-like Fe-S oxidoreductase
VHTLSSFHLVCNREHLLTACPPSLQVYWQGAPYYAFGMGAASYLQGRRFTRPGTMKSYVTWVQGLSETQQQGQGQVVPGSHLPEESRVGHC